MSNLNEAIKHTCNRYSAENGSNTPDFILSEFLMDGLAAFDKAVNRRELWYNRGPQPVENPPEAPAENAHAIFGLVPNDWERKYRDLSLSIADYGAKAEEKMKALEAENESLLGQVGSRGECNRCRRLNLPLRDYGTPTTQPSLLCFDCASSIITIRDNKADPARIHIESIIEALNEARAPKLFPDKGAEHKKPMRPRDRVEALAKEIEELKSMIHKVGAGTIDSRLLRQFNELAEKHDSLIRVMRESAATSATPELIETACRMYSSYKPMFLNQSPAGGPRCEFCGYRFDVESLGAHGCPNCHGEGLDE